MKFDHRLFLFYFKLFTSLFSLSICQIFLYNINLILQLKYLILIGFILFPLLNSYSQQKNLQFKHLHVEDGLSQSTVHAIIQDKRGYLWIGTHGGGVCKFDGINFTQYSEKNGISGNIVTGLSEDNNGNIWFILPSMNRGKIESGSIHNLIKNNYIKAIKEM